MPTEQIVEPAVEEVAGRFWREWLRVTQFLRSGLIARRRESGIWSELELKDPSAVKLLEKKSGPLTRDYTIGVHGHIASLQDNELFFAAALIHAYALAEAAAAETLEIRSATVDMSGGIERWGTALLTSNPNKRELADAGPWSTTTPLASVVKAAIVRNAFAHGSYTVSATQVNRLNAALERDQQTMYVVPNQVDRSPANLVEGETLSLTFEDFLTHQDSIRRMMRVAGLRVDRGVATLPPGVPS